MRKQYHFRPTADGVLIWDVDRLIALSQSFPVIDCALSVLQELDETFWFREEDAPPTCRAVAKHAKLIRDVDLSYPIILSADGRLMDGMHRVCRAFIEGHDSIQAVQFLQDPLPDYVDVPASDLSYER